MADETQASSDRPSVASQLRLADCWRPPVLIATGFGAGLAPRAPGTIGTLPALPIWWFVLAPLPPAIYASAVLAVILIGTGLIALATRHTGVKDDQSIVIDEWAGVWLALFLAPQTLLTLIAGFVLFRAFDIMKPFPVSWADRRIPGSWGVMLDDLFAGAMALAVLQAGLWALG
jgi:phosphatidylglycerophosphatase A